MVKGSGSDPGGPKTYEKNFVINNVPYVFELICLDICLVVRVTVPIDSPFLLTNYAHCQCTALYRTLLPVHRKLIQWLLGPSPSLSATRDCSTVTGPDSKSVRTRSKFIQLTVVDDINAKAVEA
jgi:hypothetical protein